MNFSYMILNKRSMCNLWIHWTPWDLFPFLITPHLATLHQHLKGLCYHRLQRLYNLKIIYIKQDDILTRQGTIGRARLQITVLVTNIWVEFNYLKSIHVAPICISKLVKYQHLHSLFRGSLAQPVRHTGSSSPTLQLASKREKHTFFAHFSDLSCPLWTEIKRNATTNSQGSWMLREANLSSAVVAVPHAAPAQTQQPIVSMYHTIIHW